MWLDYIKFLLVNNEQPRATSIYKQAMKFVKDPNFLESHYHQLIAEM
ncbi:6853_t:CDS:1, partial [Scutellospora calospora]